MVVGRVGYRKRGPNQNQARREEGESAHVGPTGLLSGCCGKAVNSASEAVWFPSADEWLAWIFFTWKPRMRPLVLKNILERQKSLY